MKLTSHCPLCSKALVLKSECQLGSFTVRSFTCGHTFTLPTIAETEPSENPTLDYKAADLTSNKAARPYQELGVQFITQSNFNAIISYQMRLGKTPTSLLALKNYYIERTPCLILVRSANLWQWIEEYKTWCDTLPNGIFPITSTESWIVPGFKTYIISMDTFATQGKCKCGHRYHEKRCEKKNCDCKIFQSDGNSVIDRLKKIPFKLVIADEAHSFKNPTSNRSQQLTAFIDFLNTGEESSELAFTCNACNHEWIERGTRKFDKRIAHTVISKSTRCPLCGQFCYIQQQHKLDSSKPENRTCGLVMLTGTPIKNRADEYFVPLNLLDPQKFNSLDRFRTEWLEQTTGGFTHVKSYKLEKFKKTLAPYVLRVEKEDVFKELPALNRIFTVVQPDKSLVAEQYNKILDQMEQKLADKANPSYWDMATEMMELRRICGLMKLPWVADLMAEALDSSETQRFAIGLHHKTVRDILFLKLGTDRNCIKFSGEDSAERKFAIQKSFATSQQRLLLINMLAGGVGCDFHYCDNVLILERGWSSADEEQFEYRFYNPDITINPNPTTVEYVVAKGTIDQFFYDLVERKRQIFGQTVSNNWNMEQDAGTFRQLLELTLASRL